MEKGRLILFFFVILTSVIYIIYALPEEPLIITSSAFPEITLKFDERVYILNATIKKDLRFYKLNVTYPENSTIEEVIGKSIDELNSGNDALYPRIPNTNYVLKLAEPLSNGNYTFSITVSDVVGNNATKTASIIVSAPYMNFFPEEPPLFVSPQKLFDFSIRTQHSSECRFLPSALYSDDPEKAYANAVYFFSDFGTLHTVYNFNNASVLGREIITSPQTEFPIYIYCNQTSGAEAGRIHPSVFNISYDLTPPTISARAEPRAILEKVDGRVKTTITVNSDDKVVCRHSWVRQKEGSETDFVPDTQNFAEMVRFVSNETDPYTYTKNPSKEIDFTDLIVDVRKNYSFVITVACMNRATFKEDMLNDYTRQISNFVNVTIPVSLLSPVQITVNSPAPFTSLTDINLNITTSKTASCSYIFQEKSEVLSTADGKIHTAFLGTLGEGNHSVKIDCTAPEGTGSIDYKFVIDLSPPSPPIITAPSAVCSNLIGATFSAIDNQSGIAGYNWSLRGAAEISRGIVSGATAAISVERDSAGNPLNLSSGIIYTFSAISQNRAGLWSAEGVSNGTIYDETGILCDKNPPLVLIKQNSTESGTVVSLLCIDKETRCDNSTYQYFISQDRKCGGLFSPLDYSEQYNDFAVAVFQSGYFCFKAKDVAGNEANGSEQIRVLTDDFCTNNVKDATETGIDCGGPNNCPRCELDAVCSSDRDCSSGYCDQSSLVCKTPLCTDNIKNGYETDIDCGGNCEKCEIGKKCKTFSDCESNFCNSEGICAEASCTDKIANGNETDIDCGGNCEKCEDGKECLLDSDCESGKCSKIAEGKGVCVVPMEKALAALKEKKEVSILKIIFLIIGFLSTFSGSGYLSYKKYKEKKKPVTAIAAAPATKPAAVSFARRISPAEQIRRLIARQRLRREAAEKEKTRERLFEAFGKPKEKIPEAKIPEAKPILEKIAIKPKAEKPKGEFERLEEIGKKAEAAEEFEKLEKLKPTERGKKIIEEIIKKKRR